MDDDLIDPAALADSIGKDIFGAEGESQDSSTSGLPSSAQDPVGAPAATQAPAVNLRPLPKSWKKEMEAHWGKLPPEVHDYVYQREGDVTRGISEYKQGFDAWSQLTSPYQALLQQYPQVNPIQLFSNLMQSHLTLADPRRSPEQKRALAMQLLQEYGIDLTGAAQPPIIPPEITGRISAMENHLYQTTLESSKKQVESFFKDPANKFAEELQDDILRLIQSGQAPSLQAAYEQAMWLNPVVRQKVIEGQLAASAETAKQEATKRAGLKKLNGSSEDASGSPTAPVGSIDDTMQSVLAKHYPKH